MKDISFSLSIDPNHIDSSNHSNDDDDDYKNKKILNSYCVHISFGRTLRGVVLVSLTRVRQSDKKHNSTLVRILLLETVPVLIFTIIIVEISVFVLFLFFYFSFF